MAVEGLTDALLKIAGFIIALSGWGKVLYDHITSKPKIRGRVFQVMRGQMTDPANHQQRLTTFTTYLYLVNKRRNSIHVLDYEMNVKTASAWVRLKRVYGVHKINNMSFLDTQGRQIRIENFQDNLIYRKNLPVEYGKPLHGWIVFAGDDMLYREEIAEYRLTCVDAYRRRHTMGTKPKEFENLNLLQDMAGISLPNERPN